MSSDIRGDSVFSEYGTAILPCPAAALKLSRQGDGKADISNGRRYIYTLNDHFSRITRIRESGPKLRFVTETSTFMQVTLKPLSKGRPIVFDKTILLIGRHAGCDVILQRSRKISRKHCCLARSGDRLLIRDLGSMNGVWVNGTRVRCEVELQIGDEIAIGDLVYRLEETKNGQNGRRKKAKDGGADAKSSEQAADLPDPLPLDMSQDVPIPIPEESQSFRVEPSNKKLTDERLPSESAEEVL